MARRAKRRPARASKVTSIQSSNNIDMHTTHTDLDPATSPSHKHRCIQARQKYTSKHSPTSNPTLGDRFHALPPELRREIFSLLLVRPVKWQLAHHESCPLTLHEWSIYPDIYSADYSTCIRCFAGIHDHSRVPLWRHLQARDPDVPKWHKMSGGKNHVVWTNPWRSQYAPKVANEFLCSDCWDLEFRPRPHPAQEEVGKRHLRCLCARRHDLGVLMVCRRWYEEAGAVLYARNTFAFESAAVFKGLMSCLPSHWRQKVTRVSIMAYHIPDPAGPNEQSSGWESNRKILPLFRLLHQLPRLSYLELDAHFLSRAKIAHRLLKLSHPNVRRVCFIQHNLPLNRAKHSPFIWPEYHSARLMVGGFAEEVARAIKGQKCRRGLRTPTGVSTAAEREEVREERLFQLPVEEVGVGNVIYSASATAYGRLWWSEQKNHAGGTAAHLSQGLNGLHAYIGTNFTHLQRVRAEANAGRQMEENWRDWTPTSLHDNDFGIRNPSLWRVKAGWDFLLPIQTEEFLDESAKERRGWEFLGGIELPGEQ